MCDLSKTPTFFTLENGVTHLKEVFSILNMMVCKEIAIT